MKIGIFFKYGTLAINELLLKLFNEFEIMNVTEFKDAF